MNPLFIISIVAFIGVVLYLIYLGKDDDNDDDDKNNFNGNLLVDGSYIL